jgi:hypothetical protein
MTQEELQQARTNPDFLNYLEEKEKDALQSNKIADLYEVLDTLLILDLDEQRIHSVYGKILEVAFNSIEQRLKDEKKLEVKGEDLYLVRAFYEHSIEKWSYGDFNGAKELFFILTNIVDDSLLEDACAIKMLACANNEDMEAFYDTKVAHQEQAKDENYAYFLLDFKFDTKKYLDENGEQLQTIHEELKHLLGV